MDRKLVAISLVVSISGSLHAFTDSLWMVGGQGCPGNVVTVEVWLQYEGGGSGDSISAFDIPLTYDATICTVETITIGPDFAWDQKTRIDNDGRQEPQGVPKIGISAFTFGPPIGPPFAGRGKHLAATVDFRILHSATPGDAAYIDTLTAAFSPQIYLGYHDRYGKVTYRPQYIVAEISVHSNVCDVGPVSIVNLPDTVMVDSTYIASAIIKNFGVDPAGAVTLIFAIDSWADTVRIPSIPGLESVTADVASWNVSHSGIFSVEVFTEAACDTNPANDRLLENYIGK